MSIFTCLMSHITCDMSYFTHYVLHIAAYYFKLNATWHTYTACYMLIVTTHVIYDMWMLHGIGVANCMLLWRMTCFDLLATCFPLYDIGCVFSWLHAFVSYIICNAKCYMSLSNYHCYWLFILYNFLLTS